MLGLSYLGELFCCWTPSKASGPTPRVSKSGDERTAVPGDTPRCIALATSLCRHPFCHAWHFSTSSDRTACQLLRECSCTCREGHASMNSTLAAHICELRPTFRIACMKDCGGGASGIGPCWLCPTTSRSASGTSVASDISHTQSMPSQRYQKLRSLNR